MTDAGLPTVDDLKNAALAAMRATEITGANDGEWTAVMDDMAASDALDALIAAARAEGEAAGRIAGLRELKRRKNVMVGIESCVCHACEPLAEMLAEAERPSAPEEGQ